MVPNRDRCCAEGGPSSIVVYEPPRRLYGAYEDDLPKYTKFLWPKYFIIDNFLPYIYNRLQYNCTFNLFLAGM